MARAARSPCPAADRHQPSASKQDDAATPTSDDQTVNQNARSHDRVRAASSIMLKRSAQRVVVRDLRRSSPCRARLRGTRRAPCGDIRARRTLLESRARAAWREHTSRPTRPGSLQVRSRGPLRTVRRAERVDEALVPQQFGDRAIFHHALVPALVMRRAEEIDRAASSRMPTSSSSAAILISSASRSGLSGTNTASAARPAPPARRATRSRYGSCASRRHSAPRARRPSRGASARMLARLLAAVARESVVRAPATCSPANSSGGSRACSSLQVDEERRERHWPTGRSPGFGMHRQRVAKGFEHAIRNRPARSPRRRTVRAARAPGAPPRARDAPRDVRCSAAAFRGGASMRSMAIASFSGKAPPEDNSSSSCGVWSGSIEARGLHQVDLRLPGRNLDDRNALAHREAHDVDRAAGAAVDIVAHRDEHVGVFEQHVAQIGVGLIAVVRIRRVEKRLVVDLEHRLDRRMRRASTRNPRRTRCNCSGVRWR